MLYPQDIRYAFRLLLKQPMFTALTLAVLGGGLGIAVFAFAFLYTAMVRPLPVPGGDRIVRIEQTTDRTTGLLDAADLAAVRPRLTRLTDIGAYTSRAVIVGEGDGLRVMDATAAEWNVFEVTRTRPLLGRGLLPSDQEPGATPVVVLGHRAWRVVLGGDSALVGRDVMLDGVPTRVVGVMPEGYGFPVAAEAWVPIRPGLLTLERPGEEAVSAWARLADGADAAQAGAELAALVQAARQARAVRRDTAAAPASLGVASFPMAQIGEEGPLAFTVLNLLAALILLLACVNAVNLLLVRVNERSREIAIRLALGAPRSRLVMQSLWEIVLLCGAGGVVATGIAAWGLDAVTAWTRANLEGNLAFWWVWRADGVTLVAAGAFVTLAVTVLGLVVGRRAAEARIVSVLQDGSNAAGGRREGRLSRGLVITQVATVSVLLFFGVMAGVVAHRVVSVDLGYDTRRLLTAGLALPESRYPDATSRGVFLQRAHDRLAEQPAIDGVVLRAPLAELAAPEGVFVYAGSGSEVATGRAYVVAALGDLGLLGAGLREGRAFDLRDEASGARTALVSASLASRTWPGTTPVGRQVQLTGLGERAEWRTVVGVVDDVPLGNPLSRDRSPVVIYVPLRQTAAPGATAIFRHRGQAGAAQAALHLVLRDLDATLEPPQVGSFDEMLAKTSLMARAVTRLFGLCFAFALVLAVSGTYGLMARSILRRTREIGVRRALGATDRTIVLMLLGQGARQLGVGALVALPPMLLVAVGFSHYFPVARALSMGSAVLVVLAVSGVVLLATWIPTRRAIRVEPRDALWQG
jgi:predicted permease